MIDLNANAWGDCTPKEKPDHLKGEFYLKLVCDINNTEVEVSKVKLEDFNESLVYNIYITVLG